MAPEEAQPVKGQASKTPKIKPFNPKLGNRQNANMRNVCLYSQLAVGQNQWYHVGVDEPPIVVYCSGDWDVRWGYDLAFDPWPSCCSHATS